MPEENQSKQSLSSAARNNDSSKEKYHKNSKGEKRKHQRSRSRSHSRSKSRSPKHKSYKKSEINHDIPDRSFGDLFCRACDCHMNGEHMWESHIQGKRHMKNTKSGAPVDQKYEYIKEDPIIKPEIDADTRPIVGLEHTCEIRRLEQMPIYSCFLCSATLPNSQRLIEHMLGLKHRQAFLKEHDSQQYKLIQESQLRKCHLESIIEEYIVLYEKNHGRGKMIVKKEKNKTASYSYEKGYSSDHDSNSNHKYSRHERGSYSEWKTISSCGSSYYKRERHSSDYKSDSDIDHHSKEEPHSRSEYYRTALGKEASPPRSVRNISGSKYYSKEEPESRSTYYQRASVKEAISPNIVKSVSDSKYYSEEEPGSRSSVYQSSLVNEISPPQIMRSVDGSGYYSEEASESRSTYYQSSENETSLPKIVRNVSGSSHLWADEHEKVDLRDILRQKKSLGTSSLAINNSITSAVGSNAIVSSATESTIRPSTASLLPSNSVTDISESMLKFINDLTPEVFFHLVLFKLDNMEIHDEKYIELLDCLINRATVLSSDIKKNKVPPSLQAKFHESMAQNGIYPQNKADFDQNLNSFIQLYKSNKLLDKSHNHFEKCVLDKSDLHLSQSNSNYYPAKLNSGNYSRCLAPSANTSTSLENMGNQNSNLIPFKGFSSTPSSIPGLTFGEEINSQPQNPATEINQLQSPFEHLSENAKNILGYFNRPLSKDYNHR